MDHTPAYSLKKKIEDFINSLNDCGVTQVNINMTARESHFLPELKAKKMEVNGDVFYAQHYFPSTVITASVVMRVSE